MWNWKTALNSALYRGIAFAAATWRNGAAECAGGVLTQMLLFSAMAGYTGSLTQRFRNHTPRWQAGLMLLCLVPLGVHSMEWVVHETLDPGARRAGIAVSWVQSAISMGTQWALMRRDLFLAGGSGLSYAQDFRAMAEWLAQVLRRVIQR